MSQSLSCLIKFIQILKALFWKNSNIIYINSNKKIFDQSILDKLSGRQKYKKIINESNVNKIGYASKEYHFQKMKIQLYQITRNLRYKPEIVYAGYVSTPFAIYDGYCLGDNHNYTFFDTTKDVQKSYRINFAKKRYTTTNNFDLKNNLEEVNLLISSSYTINYSHIDSEEIYEYKNIIGDKLNDEDLNDVFYYVSDFLDECRNKNVNRVNLFCSSRQPIAFVVGSAIQKHHPEVYAFEYEGGKYTWSVNIQKGKLIKVSG